MKTSLRIRYVLESKVLQDVPVKFFLVTRTMQVMFVLRFYHPDKTDKINRLIHDSGSKDKLSCQNADVCIKIVSSTAGNIHSFPQKKKKTLRIIYPKYPVLDMIQRIHLRYGSFGSIFLFFILEKKRNKISVSGLKGTFKNKCPRNWMFGLSAMIRWEN